MGYSPATQRLLEELQKLPGIGAKTAERLAFHLLRSSESDVESLLTAIEDVKKNVRPCSSCFSLGETDPCPICADPARDSGTICVVEEQKDLLAMEKIGSYTGVYHVLMGSLSPLDGVEPDDLTIPDLERRVRAGPVREVILATNPNTEGDCTALYLARRLGDLGVRVTRLARGIPSGSSIEFASGAILSDALEGRVAMEDETSSGAAGPS
jgi:recombination protein RecR